MSRRPVRTALAQRPPDTGRAAAGRAGSFNSAAKYTGVGVPGLHFIRVSDGLSRDPRNSKMKGNEPSVIKNESTFRPCCDTIIQLLERALHGDTDVFSQKLPYFLSNIFGVPLPELTEDFSLKSDDLPQPPRALILSNNQEGHNDLLKLLISAKSDARRYAEEDLNLIESIRKLTYRNGYYDYKFPRQYLPSSLQDKVENSIYSNGVSTKMVSCTALELLLFSMAALPLIHFEDVNDDGQISGYLQLVRYYSDVIFGTLSGFNGSFGEPHIGSRVGTSRSEDSKFSHSEKDRVVQILTSFWLNPSVCFKGLYFRSKSLQLDPPESLESWVTHLETRSIELAKSRMRLNRRVAQAAEALFSRLKLQDPASLFQSWTELAFCRAYGFLRWALAEVCIEWKTQHNEREKDDVEDFQRYVAIWGHITCPRFWDEESVDGRYKETYVLNNFPFFTISLIDIFRAIRIMFQDSVNSSSRSQLVDSALDTLFKVLDCILGSARESRTARFIRVNSRVPVSFLQLPDCVLKFLASGFELLVTIGPETWGLTWLGKIARFLFVNPPLEYRRKWELALQARGRVAEAGGGGGAAAPMDLLRRWLAGSFAGLHPAEVLARLQDGAAGDGSGAAAQVERRILDQELNELLMLDDYVLAVQPAAAGAGAGWGGEAELQWVPAVKRAQVQPRFLMGGGRSEAPAPRIQWEQLYQASTPRSMCRAVVASLTPEIVSTSGIIACEKS